MERLAEDWALDSDGISSSASNAIQDVSQERVIENRWKEIDQLREGGTLTVVPVDISRSKLFMPTKWVDTTDKARLVAKEISMYMSDEFFAPSSTTFTSELVDLAASTFKLSPLCVDVARAFLHCEENEEVYMKPQDIRLERERVEGRSDDVVWRMNNVVW